MNPAQQETTLNGMTIQPENILSKPSSSADKETEQRSKTNSFIEIVRRLSINSLPPLVPTPKPTDLETSKDENDSPSISSPETKDLNDKKRVCLSLRVLLQYCTFFALCFNILISTGLSYSLGVLYVSFREEFQTTKAVTALIISVCVGIFGFGGVFSGMLVNRIGVRWTVVIGTVLCFLGIFSSAFVTNIWQLFFTLGILLGAGASIINIATMTSVSKIFNKNKNTMIMLVTGSGPVSTFFMPLLLKLLIDFYAWRGSLIFLSGLALNMCFAGFLSTYSEQPTTEIKEKPKYFDKSILRNKFFMAALIVSTVASSCLTAFNLLVVDFWKEKGNSMSESVILLVIGSSAAIASRFFFGICNTIRDLSNHYFAIYYCTTIVGGLCLALIPQCVTFTQVVIAILIYNFFHGIMSTVRPAIVLKTVGLSSYSVAFGLVYTVFGLGTALATTVAGKISDVIHSYDVSFYLAGITQCVVTLIVFAVHLLLERNQKKTRNKSKGLHTLKETNQEMPMK